MMEILREKEMQVKEALEALNIALKGNNATEVNKREDALKSAEAEYAKTKMELTYDACKATENPMISAITKHHIEVIGHKANRDGDIVVDYELVYDKEKQIDLVKFCRWIEASTTWQYKVEKLGWLLCLRAAKELGLNAAQIEKISTSYYMDKKARELDMGKTPTSNTQICKLLQTVIDAILYEDDGKGANKYKCNSHDVAYLSMTYTRRGKRALVISVAKTSFVHSIVADVLHRIVTGKKYDVDYKMKKGTDDEPSKPETEQKADEALATKDEPKEVVVHEPEAAEPIVIEKVPVK